MGMHGDRRVGAKDQGVELEPGQGQGHLEGLEVGTVTGKGFQIAVLIRC